MNALKNPLFQSVDMSHEQLMLMAILDPELARLMAFTDADENGGEGMSFLSAANEDVMVRESSTDMSEVLFDATPNINAGNSMFVTGGNGWASGISI